MGKLDYKLFSIVIFAISALMVAGATQYASAGACPNESVTAGDFFIEWDCGDDLDNFEFLGFNHMDETEIHICGTNPFTAASFGGCTATDLKAEIHDVMTYTGGSSDDVANTITLNFEALGGDFKVKVVFTLVQISATAAEVTGVYTFTTCEEDDEDCHVDVKFIHTTNPDLNDEGDFMIVEYNKDSRTATFTESGTKYEVESEDTIDFLGICDEFLDVGKCVLDDQSFGGHLGLDASTNVPPAGMGEWEVGYQYDFSLGHTANDFGPPFFGPVSQSITILERLILNPCAPPGGPGGPFFLLGLLVPEQFRAYGGTSEEPEPCADLSITKTADDDSPRIGDFVTFRIEVTNDGPEDVDFVEIIDSFTHTMELKYMDLDDISGHVDKMNSNIPGEIRIVLEDLQEGETATFDLEFQVLKIGPIDNFIEITEVTVDTQFFGDVDVFDPDSTPDNGDGVTPQEDDEAALTITGDCVGANFFPGVPGFILSMLVPEQFRAYGGTTFFDVPCADLSITKVVSDETPVVGGPVTYFFTLTNDGPDFVEEVEVTDFFNDEKLDFLGHLSIQGCTFIDEDSDDEINIETCDGIDSGETIIFSLTFEVLETGSFVNFAEITEAQFGDDDDELEIFDPDSTPDNGDGVTPQEDDEAAVKTSPCNDEEPGPLPEFENFLLGLLVPEMYQVFGGTTIVIPIVPCSTTSAAGAPYDDPTLGITIRSGYFAIQDGFCFDQYCLDVLEYFNHLPIQQVSSGSTHTITLTAYIPNGVRVANYASVGASPPGTDINSVEWNMIIQRNAVTGEHELTEYDPNNMIGTVTVTVQEVDLNTIIYTFNIQFLTPASIGTVDGNATPPEDNMFIVTEIRDSNGGSARNIFNEGIFVDDIYAYPQIEGLYQLPVEVESLCLNEDSTQRYTCAFDLVREWTIKQAEEKLKEMYNEKGTDMDSFEESERY